MPDLTTRAAGVLAALFVMSACQSSGEVLGGQGAGGGQRVVIGSKPFSESIVVAKLYGEALAAEGYAVEYRHTLEASDILTPPATTTGVDLYTEYTGAVLADAMPDRAAVGDADAAYGAAAAHLAEQGHTVLAMAPASHQEGVAVTRGTANALGVETISDLAAASGELVLAGPADCPERRTCLPGLADVYGARFEGFTPIEADGMRYQALADGRIDVAAVVVTDPEIAVNDLFVPDDDRDLYPAYNVIPVVRSSYLDRAPARFAEIVDGVSARLTSEALAALNARVEVELLDPGAAAVAWLRDQGLVE